MVLLACGIGDHPAARRCSASCRTGPGEATLVYRARSEAEVAFRGELDWFAAPARRPGGLSAGRRGPTGASWLPAEFADHADADALRQIVPDVARSHVYVCGPEAWTEAARTAARTAGVPAERLHTELFSW